MASSCVFVWYLVARSINPRLFLPDVAIVSFVLRRDTLVSPPKQQEPGARPGSLRENEVFAEA
jgi:hypothetical protein